MNEEKETDRDLKLNLPRLWHFVCALWQYLITPELQEVDAQQKRQPPKIRLTPEELKALELASEGHTSQFIAIELSKMLKRSVSERRVNKLLGNKRIYKKLGVQSRGEAIRWYVENITMAGGSDVKETGNKTRFHSDDRVFLNFIRIFAVLYGCVIGFLFVPVWFQWFQSSCTTCFANRYVNLYLVLPLIAGLAGLVRLRKHNLPVFNPYRLVQEYLSLFRVYIERTNQEKPEPQFEKVYLAPTLSYYALIGWALGNVIWIGLDLFKTDETVHYPSLADSGYIVEAVFWMFGISILPIILGTNVLQRAKQLLSWVLFFELLIVGINLFARGKLLPEDPLKFAFDIIYPIFDVINLTLLIYLLRNQSFKDQKDATMRLSLLIMFGGTLLFLITGLLFCITTSRQNFFTGNLVDFLFATSLFIMSIGVWRIPLKTSQYSEEITMPPGDLDRDKMSHMIN